MFPYQVEQKASELKPNCFSFMKLYQFLKKENAFWPHLKQNAYRANKQQLSKLQTEGKTVNKS